MNCILLSYSEIKIGLDYGCLSVKRAKEDDILREVFLDENLPLDRLPLLIKYTFNANPNGNAILAFTIKYILQNLHYSCIITFVAVKLIGSLFFPTRG